MSWAPRRLSLWGLRRLNRVAGVAGVKVGTKRAIRIVAVMAACAFIATIGLVLLVDYRTKIEDAVGKNERLVRTLEVKTTQYLLSVDAALAGIAQVVTPAALSPDAQRVLQQMLGRTLPTALGLQEIWILDRDGRPLAGSVPIVGQRPWPHDEPAFAVHVGTPFAGLFIDSPQKDAVTGQWELYLSRRVSLPDGSFFGVVVAKIRVAALSQNLATVNTSNSEIFLTSDSGALIASDPHAETLIGRNTEYWPAIAAQESSHPSGTVQSTGEAGTTIVSYRPVPGRSLLVYAVSPRVAAIAAWLDDVWVMSGAALLILIGLAALTHVAIRQVGEQEALEAARRARELDERTHQAYLIERRFSDAIEASPAAVALYDDEDRLLSWNHKFKEYFFPRSSSLPFRGLSFDELMMLHARTNGLEPGSVGFEQLMRTRREWHRASDRSFVTQLPDGRWIQTTKTRTADGGTIGIDTDVTELQDGRDALRRSEAEFRASFDFAPIGMSLLDRALRFVKVNPALCRLLGYAESELIGRSVKEITHTDALDDPSEAASALDGETFPHQRVEKRYVTKHGTVIPALVQVAAIRDEGGRVQQYLTQVLDLTEIKHAAAEREYLLNQIHRAQKLQAIGTLAGGVAHDFNNILVAIRGYTQMAIEALDDGHPVREDLKQVAIAGERAQSLVRQILAFSRKEPGERKVLSLSALVSEALTLLRPTLPRTTEIKVAIEGDANVFGDSSQLHQAIVNLCVNASQALNGNPGSLTIEVGIVMIDGGCAEGLSRLRSEEAHHPLKIETAADDSASRLWAALLRSGPHVRLRVTDSGVGMDRSVISRIFEPFFTTKAVGQGTGLGLAAVHGIITAHEGAIYVESKVGAGTCFDIYLPCADQPAVADRGSPTKPQGRLTGRVMVVDDEPAVLNVMERTLQRAGFEVTGLANPTNAWDIFRQDPSRWDLVISDQSMPDMPGLELCSRIRALRPDLPLVLCTGHHDGIDDVVAAQSGVSFVLKPVVGRELVLMVQGMLDKRAVRRRPATGAHPA